MNIYTHDGQFHGDEVVTVALFKMFVEKNVSVIRTRDKVILEEAKNNNEAWVFDVGGEHDVNRKCFDHHQERTPVAACGRFMNFLLTDGLSYAEDKLGGYAEEVLQELKKEVTDEVDLQDTGNSKCPETVLSISKIVTLFNEEDIFSEEQNIAFDNVVSMVKEILSKFVENSLSRAKKRSIVLKLIEEQKGCRVLVMDEFPLPWKETILNNPELLENFEFAVFPSGKEWRIQAMPNPDEMTPFSIRTRIDSSKVEGKDGFVFCHPGGFICGFKTKQQTLKAVASILE